MTSPEVDVAVGFPDVVVSEFEGVYGDLWTVSEKFTVFSHGETIVKHLGQCCERVRCVECEEARDR